MKIGIRKPSLKKSLKARTTGKLKRQLKKSINPFYGKKGMGWIRDPGKAAYNKVYHKVTIDPLKPLKTGVKKSTRKRRTTTINNKVSNQVYPAPQYEVDVNDFMNYHLYCRDEIMWISLLNADNPIDINGIGPTEHQTMKSPGLLGLIFSKSYEKKLDEARMRDGMLEEEWKKNQKLVQGVLNGDLNSYLEAFYLNLDRDFVSEFTNTLNITINNKDSITLNYNLLTAGLPTHYINPETGRQKKYTQSEYYTLEKHFAFSTMMRLANETYKILPVDTVEMVVYKNGNLIINWPSTTVSIKNVYYLDEIEEIEEYLQGTGAKYKFLKTKGFKALEEVES